MYKVSIVIPIYNGIENTLICLNSLSHIKYINYEVIVVDDGSTDNSSEIILKNYPKVKLLYGDGNLWWSGGVNKGIKYALENGSDYVLLLNNDNFIENDILEILMNVSNNYPNSIISSAVYDSKNNELIDAGGFFSLKQGLKLYKKYEDVNQCREIEWCGGMGVLIPKNIFENIGLFDDISFPQYYGDADFMYRARKLRYKILSVPFSKVYNNVETTGLSAKIANFKDLKDVLFSIRSNNNIIINWKFYKRHFGVLRTISVIISRYYYIIGGFTKRFLKFRIIKGS
ncbi:glycosyltransferase family 2 protein [Gottfriedia acidiceleris]|uniref:glycosyltransferase family 2 protein n=1 Tax=Gottfriedia acidiceleris TaxID=371036 RepID=UPI000B43082F|nr:glycosyltransferase family 2 protein [Gottfriedia acidiceleris]